MSDGFAELTAVPAGPAAENAEIITALLAEYPFSTFDFDGNAVKAWADENGITPEIIHTAMEEIMPFCADTPVWKIVPRQNWNEEWEKQYFQPVSIGKQVHIRAPFHPQVEGFDYVISIEPRMSFGTGHHNTTQLMLMLMLEDPQIFNTAHVLDMGSGTGVLAIMAEKLCADKALAIDNEAWAAENALENAVANECRHITSVHGDATYLKNLQPETFDVVLANIHLNILMQDGAEYLRVLKPGGDIFLSGFYATDIPVIDGRFRSLGCTLVAQKEQDGWAALRYRKV